MESSKKTNRNYWKEEDEILLKQWADKAQCYQWLHNKSRDIYQRKNAWYTIPVIIISTITGTGNFAQDRFNDKVRPYVVIGIGTLSILAGIITTIYQFLKIAEINEGHRIATISWGKFHRNLETELTRHPLDRIFPSELLNLSKEEYNRLVEISPNIDNNILSQFNLKFKNNKNLTKPEIGNTINSINVFTLSSDERKLMIDEINNKVNYRKNAIIKKEQKTTNRIEQFKEHFYNLQGKYPTKDEIKNNMKFIKTDIDDSDSDKSINIYDETANLDNTEVNEDKNVTINIDNTSETII